METVLSICRNTGVILIKVTYWLVVACFWIVTMVFALIAGVASGRIKGD